MSPHYLSTISKEDLYMQNKRPFIWQYKIISKNISKITRKLIEKIYATIYGES
ncbi:hypothetical protein FACS1894122_15370 [Alphaproteobacteria bacterium]|nr:hypothetical protein FACS1894122_15370 [Alphaproteobacteria bacterium]